MSHHCSTSDWIRHLHVQVAKWEENNCSKRCCLKKRIDDMTHCLAERLSTCKIQGRVPKPYSNEVDRFFEFLKDPKMDTKHISKLVKVRNIAVSLLDVFCRFCYFSEEEKQKTINKFEQKDCQDFTEIVQILIPMAPVTSSIQSHQPHGGFHDQTINDTTWLRHMYRFFLKQRNNITGRVRWRDVHNGGDPNNKHKKPVNGSGKKEEFLSKERLITELNSLVPLCMQEISMTGPYKKEIQLLQHYLDSEELDKTKIQSEQKTRRLAIDMTETLLTLLKERHLRNDVVQNIPPTEIDHLLHGLKDLDKRLLSTMTVTPNNNNLIEHHEDERNERPVHTDSSPGEHSDSSRVDQIKNINDSGCAILSDDASSRESVGATIHNTAEEGSCVLSLSCEQHHQVNTTEETGKLKLVEIGDVHDTAATACEDEDNIDLLDEEIVFDPYVFYDIPDTDILNKSFHSLLQAATEITCSSSEVYSDALKVHPVLENKILEDFENPGSVQENKSSRRPSNVKSSVTVDICTESTSFTSRDMGSFPLSPTCQIMEMDPPNDDNILETWSGLGDEFISISDAPMLNKILKKIKEFEKSAEKRLQQTNSKPKDFSDCFPNRIITAVMSESRGSTPSSCLLNGEIQYKPEGIKQNERYPSFCATLQSDAGFQIKHSVTPHSITEKPFIPEHSQYIVQTPDVSELFGQCMLANTQDSSMSDTFTGSYRRRKRKKRSLNDR